MEKEKDPRAEALILNQLLEGDDKDLVQLEDEEEHRYSIGHEEYLVLTEEEADAKAREEIERSLWAFNPDFILRHNKNCEDMDNWEYDAAIDALKEAQGKSCENLNGLVKCLISDLNEFMEDAIMEDGRGYFIAFYDGREEIQEVDGTEYYIYQVN